MLHMCYYEPTGFQAIWLADARARKRSVRACVRSWRLPLCSGALVVGTFIEIPQTLLTVFFCLFRLIVPCF